MTYNQTALVLLAVVAVAMANGPYSSGYGSYGDKKGGYDASPYGYDKKDSYGYDASPYGYDKKGSDYQAFPYGYDKKVYGYDAAAYGYNKKDSYGYDAPSYGYNKKDSYGYGEFPVTYYKTGGYEAPAYGYDKYEKLKSYGSYPSSYWILKLTPVSDPNALYTLRPKESGLPQNLLCERMLHCKISWMSIITNTIFLITQLAVVFVLSLFS